MRPILLAALLAAAAPVAVHAHEAPVPAAVSKPVPKEALLKPAVDADGPNSCSIRPMKW